MQASAIGDGSAFAPRPSRRRSGKSDEIVQAVIDICRNKGFSHITIKDIAKQVGMTRSLFYHYFPDKEALAQAMVDKSVDQVLIRMEEWNRKRTPGDVEGALKTIVQVARSVIADNSPLRQQMIHSGNGELYTQFVDQVSKAIADYFCRTAVQDFTRHHQEHLPIDHVREMLIVLISGSITLLRVQPDTSDEAIICMAAQTLHLEPYL
ncbi:TetR/AcrR family transcriptional regulator [uncultured Bifidobacterium sp.]|uniref:TetR/AcrR family transcriptional regulator n=1 Tax=uncultured Bifidobacterium sp. TaxID=165187 RepID=UPI0026069C91|nr:TetR/AcrR family transcriptional regulator [uncultured Bifidobacterium sp.]